MPLSISLETTNSIRNRIYRRGAQFIDMLVDQLATPRADQKVAEEGYDMRYVGLHTPLLFKRETVVVDDKCSEVSIRAQCSVCKKRVNQFCMQYGMIPLCFSSDYVGISCWEQWHTIIH